jgi:hypothetical protein
MDRAGSGQGKVAAVMNLRAPKRAGNFLTS